MLITLKSLADILLPFIPQTTHSSAASAAWHRCAGAPLQVKRGRGSFRRISYNLLLKQVRMSTSRDHQHNEYIIILLPY